MNLIEKLSKIQQELVAPKNQRNAFGNYSYRSAEDIMSSVKPLLNKYNVAITCGESIFSENERVFVESTITLWDGESEQFLTNKSPARETEERKGMDSAQITGSAISYCRKYALSGLLLCDDTPDADRLNDGTPTPPAPTNSPDDEFVDDEFNF
tara:strand:- start:5199 stop:5660 length:462 start_codon:yes stop_codon:yes gene_type:complete